VIYDLLFKASSETMLRIAADPNLCASAAYVVDTAAHLDTCCSELPPSPKAHHAGAVWQGDDLGERRIDACEQRRRIGR
jgi:hypothetical protein